VALLAREVGEGHPVRAADFRVEVMNLARESIGRQPFHHRVRIKERPVNSLRRRLDHSMESDSVGIALCHDFLLSMITEIDMARPECSSRRRIQTFAA
jgi:hypothetical protein